MFDDIRAILFDLDGTLIEQRVDFARMRRDVCTIVERFGVDSARWDGMYVLEMAEQVRSDLAARDARACASFTEDVRLAIESVELEAAEGASPFPGVPEMLLDLRARALKVGIVTRNCRRAVERVLHRHPLVCDVLLTRDEARAVKPDPRHLLQALQSLQVPAFQAVMCGDHPSDILAGRRAGTRTVGVLPASAEADYFCIAAPDLVVAHVTELLTRLSAPRIGVA